MAQKRNVSDELLIAQGSLPVSSDKLLLILDLMNVEYNLFNHEPLRTVLESKKIQDEVLKVKNGCCHVKNLFLCGNRKVSILLVAEQDTKIDLKKLKTKLGIGRLSFESEERLIECLGVKPGAVTPLAMITGVMKGVKILLEKKLRNCSKLYLHPLVNNQTIEMF